MIEKNSLHSQCFFRHKNLWKFSICPSKHKEKCWNWNENKIETKQENGNKKKPPLTQKQTVGERKKNFYLSSIFFKNDDALCNLNFKCSFHDFLKLINCSFFPLPLEKSFMTEKFFLKFAFWLWTSRQNFHQKHWLEMNVEKFW